MEFCFCCGILISTWGWLLSCPACSLPWYFALGIWTIGSLGRGFNIFWWILWILHFEYLFYCGILRIFDLKDEFLRDPMNLGSHIFNFAMGSFGSCMLNSYFVVGSDGSCISNFGFVVRSLRFCILNFYSAIGSCGFLFASLYVWCRVILGSQSHRARFSSN